LAGNLELVSIHINQNISPKNTNLFSFETFLEAAVLFERNSPKDIENAIIRANKFTDAKMTIAVCRRTMFFFVKFSKRK
jgi:hypothetical protein